MDVLNTLSREQAIINDVASGVQDQRIVLDGPDDFSGAVTTDRPDHDFPGGSGQRLPGERVDSLALWPDHSGQQKVGTERAESMEYIHEVTRVESWQDLRIGMAPFIVM
ncbi:uncharacterized protein Z520_11719 [Fonsecaea multimorphosa CBS 102226]|uniref:Uncharacterized protein n=1 Tax=Fonsecaea multimorphosa CBS 102226 TaxID=1442371 RepID=A0A0D2K8A3_9EURO|nr:uncharacterized protein Z520_11719 [Fonsecaea multimorphosa CBS 102226]KIX92543.1 hypothetical protein Z520_11719 [Fonsecaea multimorphosa CBS 102226]OAL17338.1 hypothetical protein AYO22_11705 [Fonsecaea multimorphosa]